MKKIKEKLVNGIFYALGSLLMLGLFIAVLILWEGKTIFYPGILVLFYLGALWAYCTIFSVGNIAKYADLKRQQKELEQNESDTT